ncbi:TPA: ABC transporter permease [Candidatus Acetothermia bacterium]|nr:ABC transporter permease [Candidatus Acetothermia bacterium]
MEIAALTLRVSLTSTALATLFCLPLGGLIHFHRFFGKRALVNVIQTLFSVPTVCVGLLVFLLFSRAGPFGVFNIMFTPTAMVIGQMFLLAPILLGLTISALSGVGGKVKDTALSLGASDAQAIAVILNEARYALVAAVVMGFGRVISEVGIAVMVGGNIRGFTRVLTTAIALETQRGAMELSLALGIILLLLAFVVNIVLSLVQRR